MKSEVIDIKKLPIKYFSKIFNDEILIYKVNEEFFAISTFCPHFGGPLEIKDGKIFFLMLKKNSNNLSSYY